MSRAPGPQGGAPADRGIVRSGDRLKIVLSGVLAPVLGGVAGELIPIRSDVAQAIGVITAGLVAFELSRLIQRRSAGRAQVPPATEPSDDDGAGLWWAMGLSLFLVWAWLGADPADPLAVRVLLGVFVFSVMFFLWVFITRFATPVPQLAVLGLLGAAGYRLLDGGLDALRQNLPLVLMLGFAAGLVGFMIVHLFRKVHVTVHLRMPEGVPAPLYAAGELTLTWVAQVESNNRILWRGALGAFEADGSQRVLVTCSLNDVAPDLNYRLDAVLRDTAGQPILATPDAPVRPRVELIGQQVDLTLQPVMVPG